MGEGVWGERWVGRCEGLWEGERREGRVGVVIVMHMLYEFL